MSLTKLAQVAVFLTVAAGAAGLWNGRLLGGERTTGSEHREWAEPARLIQRSLLLDIAKVGEALIAVGERGHVLVSDDEGSDWLQARVPTRSMLTAIATVDETHAWVVGHDAVIIHTADRGHTWTRQFFAPEEEAPLLDVWFEDTKHGLAVGAYGLLLETRDGGTSWVRRSISEEDPHFYAITESPDGTLYIVGEFGSAFRSRDRGASWTALPSPYKGSFFGALAPSDGTLLVFGLRGNLYRSEDDGLNWRKVETGTMASLMSGVELSDGPIFIVGLSGTMLISRDAGHSFSDASRTDRQGLAAVVELRPEHLLAVGEAGLSPIQDLSNQRSKSKSRS